MLPNSRVQTTAVQSNNHSIRPRDGIFFIGVFSGLLECCPRGAAQFGRLEIGASAKML
jgi:hypothetical protein